MSAPIAIIGGKSRELDNDGALTLEGNRVTATPTTAQLPKIEKRASYDAPRLAHLRQTFVPPVSDGVLIDTYELAAWINRTPGTIRQWRA
jgi:hypothetical protein